MSACKEMGCASRIRRGRGIIKWFLSILHISATMLHLRIKLLWGVYQLRSAPPVSFSSWLMATMPVRLFPSVMQRFVTTNALVG